MNITVIGCGRWGSCLAWYFSTSGHDVLIYGRADSESYKKLSQSYRNEYLVLPESVKFTSDLTQALSKSDVIIVSIAAQNTISLFNEIATTNVKNKIYVLCMKGLIESDGRRLSEVAIERLDYTSRVAVWVGPGHVENFTKRIPSCMVISSSDIELSQGLCKDFSSDIIRFYHSDDLIGTEIGAASKNVMGICAGLLDGYSLSTLKGPLMARGPREISRLVEKMGGDIMSVYGLSHIGDYEATLFSQHSHNRAFGEAFAKKENYKYLAEGYSTTKALMVLSKKYSTDMPITSALYSILFENADPDKTVKNLFLRSLKSEF